MELNDVSLSGDKKLSSRKAALSAQLADKRAAARVALVAASVPAGPGREWLERVEAGRAAALKKATKMAMQSLGGAYTTLLEELGNVRDLRRPFLFVFPCTELTPSSPLLFTQTAAERAAFFKVMIR